jgi:3-hydroxyisobutyrate dehydrogenase-like beta-hydroxyacid dehydrogenase
VANVETIGLVGTDIMGAPMALNLAKAGYQVIVYNRTIARTIAIESDGISVAGSIAEIGHGASMVITMVPDTPDVRAVINGPDGLADAMSRGSVLIDMSTISPGATKEFAERLAAKGIAMLDAPVSGGLWGAQQGTLSHFNSIEADGLVEGGTQAIIKAVEKVVGVEAKQE